MTVATWIAHAAAALVAVAFMMAALGLHLLDPRRAPPTSCGRARTGSDACAACTRSSCAEPGHEEVR